MLYIEANGCFVWFFFFFWEACEKDVLEEWWGLVGESERRAISRV
jgi:hypothetical protein